MATGIGYLVGLICIFFATRLAMKTIRAQRKMMEEEEYDQRAFIPMYILAILLLFFGIGITADAVHTWNTLSNIRTLTSFR